MTENEMELINIVREQDDPVQALRVAIETILSYLKQRGSYSTPFPVAPRERA